MYSIKILLSQLKSVKSNQWWNFFLPMCPIRSIIIEKKKRCPFDIHTTIFLICAPKKIIFRDNFYFKTRAEFSLNKSKKKWQNCKFTYYFWILFVKKLLKFLFSFFSVTHHVFQVRCRQRNRIFHRTHYFSLWTMRNNWLSSQDWMNNPTNGKRLLNERAVSEFYIPSLLFFFFFFLFTCEQIVSVESRAVTQN